MPEKPESREARLGEKMIELRIRFWTDELAEEGRIQPKHAWTSGVVRMARNESHDINPNNPRPFNSMMDGLHALEGRSYSFEFSITFARQVFTQQETGQTSAQLPIAGFGVALTKTTQSC